jgi:drug/metabolite transporter (DMT)-like permease
MVAIWIAGFARPRPRGAVWGWLVVAGILNAIGYSLVYVGEESVSGGLAAVLFGTEPLVVALLVTITRTERVSHSQIAGGLVALVGVVLIFAERVVLDSEQALGIALIACAVPVSGLYGVIVKKHTASVHPLASAMVFMVATAAALWVIVLVHGWEPLPWPPPRNSSLALLYLAVFGSVIAFTAYFYCLQQLSLMSSTMLVFMLPLIALAVDAMWEERFQMTTGTYVGVATVLLGMAIGLRLWLLAPTRAAQEGAGR